MTCHAVGLIVKSVECQLSNLIRGCRQEMEGVVGARASIKRLVGERKQWLSLKEVVSSDLKL